MGGPFGRPMVSNRQSEASRFGAVAKISFCDGRAGSPSGRAFRGIVGAVLVAMTADQPGRNVIE